MILAVRVQFRDDFRPARGAFVLANAIMVLEILFGERMAYQEDVWSML